MERPWRIRNEKKQPSVEYDPHDSADDHKSGSSVWWTSQLFAFEDAIDDWCDITELEASRETD